jgi:hypothetical protein
MKRPSKKEIRDAVQKLKEKKDAPIEIDKNSQKSQEQGSMSSQRIRKKGI